MASFVAPSRTANDEAYLHDECVICFEPLYRKEVSFLLNTSDQRCCNHYFHTECICGFEQNFRETYEPLRQRSNQSEVTESNEGNENEETLEDTDEGSDTYEYEDFGYSEEELNEIRCCPMCRAPFHHSAPIPPVEVNAQKWFELMDVDHDGSLTYDEIVVGLKSQLPLDWNEIEANVDKLWLQWDKDRNGTISFEEFADPDTGVLAYLKLTYPKNPPPEPPNLQTGYHEWFDYWDEDGNGALDKAEITRALIKTFRIYNMNKSAIEDIVEKIFPLFDKDGSGVIEREEFVAPDNLGDTISAEISHLLMIDYENDLRNLQFEDEEGVDTNHDGEEEEELAVNGGIEGYV